MTTVKLVEGKEILKKVVEGRVFGEKLPAFIVFEDRGDNVRVKIIPAEIFDDKMFELIYPKMQIVFEVSKRKIG